MIKLTFSHKKGDNEWEKWVNFFMCYNSPLKWADVDAYKLISVFFFCSILLYHGKI